MAVLNRLRVTSFWSNGAMAVATTRASFDPSAMAGPSRSPVSTPGREDHHVGHPALGELGQHQVGLEDGGGAVGGPDLLGLVHLEGQRVDGDDLPGAGQSGPLDGPGPDAAAAHDHHRLAGLHLGPVHGRAEAGGDAAADEGGGPQGHAGVDLHQ